MRGYRGSEEAVLRYLNLRESLSTLKSSDPSQGSGIIWSTRCRNWPKCRSKTWEARWSRKADDWIARCTRCNADWPGTPSRGSRGRGSGIQASRSYGDKLAELATLGLLIDQSLRRYELFCLVRYLTFSRGGRWEYEVAKEARHKWGSWPHRWSPYRVRKTLDESRQKLDQALSGAGLLRS